MTTRPSPRHHGRVVVTSKTVMIMIGALALGSLVGVGVMADEAAAAAAAGVPLPSPLREPDQSSSSCRLRMPLLFFPPTVLWCQNP